MWLLFSALVGAYAHSKGRSGTGFCLLSLILSPLIGFLVALLAATNQSTLDNQRLQSGAMRTCPLCAELVKAEAIKCRYCGATLTPPAPHATPLPVPPPPPRTPEQIRHERRSLRLVWSMLALLLGVAVIGVWVQARLGGVLATVITLRQSRNGTVFATTDGVREQRNCEAELASGQRVLLPPLQPSVVTPLSLRDEPKTIWCNAARARVYWIANR